MEKLDYQINENEIWKPISNYPQYWISTLGRIRNNKFNRILKPYKATNGYLQVTLSNNSHAKSKCIHQLMALTFLGLKPQKFEINHIDGMKENNKLSNLEYIHYAKNRRRRKHFKYCIVCGIFMPKASPKLKTCGLKCHQKKYGTEIKLLCTECGKSFYRKYSEHKRNIKWNPSKGKNVFCSKHCHGIWIAKNYGWQTEYQKNLLK